MLFYRKMRKISGKNTKKAFTILEMLLSLSIWSVFMVVFSQLLSLSKKLYKNADFTPLDGFTKILSFVKKGAIFKVEDECLIFQTLDKAKTYKITFLKGKYGEDKEKSEIFIPIKNLKYAAWSYWNADQWCRLNREAKTTSALKLKLMNEDDTCEYFIFNTAWPY